MFITVEYFGLFNQLAARRQAIADSQKFATIIFYDNKYIWQYQSSLFSGLCSCRLHAVGSMQQVETSLTPFIITQ